MNLFHVPHLQTDTVTLEGDEFRHCVQSFRHQVGDQILLTDGQGTRATARIDKIKKRALIATVETRQNVGSGRDYTLEIVIAPTKNINRIEWFVEKSVELGIDKISFITTAHSERRKIRLDRIERIALASMKQSQQYQVPTIKDLQSLESYISKAPLSDSEEGWLAHYHPDAVDLSASHTKKGNYRVLIGPEGDFSEEEIDYIQSVGWKICTLGDKRLRTETAGLAAVSYFHWIHV